MKTPEERNLAAVRPLLAAWDESKIGYDHFLADDCVYELAGFPVLRDKHEILDFLFRGGMPQIAERYGNQRLLEIRRLQVELVHLVAQGNVVFTERIDHHFTTVGEDVLTPRIVGVMEFDVDARCTGWRDYHDPAYFLGTPSAAVPGDRKVALVP